MRTRSSANKTREIDKIVDRRRDGKDGYLYRVRWKGCGAADDSWRTLDGLEGAAVALAEYERQKSHEGEEEEEEEGEKVVVVEELSEELSNDDGHKAGGGAGKKSGKVAHFADNVEKLEQRIVGGDWQKVVQNLKE